MSALDVEGVDWHGLRRLRERFLEGSAGAGSYWDSVERLRDYDRTFGERIGWKWDHVLDELELRGWSPPKGAVLDWGCGPGVAGRRFVARHPEVGPLLVHDRSQLARDYARRKAIDEGFEVGDQQAPTTLLISHVIGELGGPALDGLLDLARTATAVLWVEPGDHASSRELIAMRESLREHMWVVAPCTHQHSCWLLVEENRRHWCHHFAAPDPDVFTDPGWGRFTAETGIDLRSVPLSFLVMDTRPVRSLPPGAVHTIGRPRVYKPEIRVFGCDAEGVSDLRIAKRRLPEAYRRGRKGHLERLAVWRTEGDEVQEWIPIDAPPL